MFVVVVVIVVVGVIFRVAIVAVVVVFAVFEERRAVLNQFAVTQQQTGEVLGVRVGTENDVTEAGCNTVRFFTEQVGRQRVDLKVP